MATGAIGYSSNIIIGESLVTVFEPLIKCYKCKSRKPKSEFGSYRSCASCRESNRKYLTELRERKLREQKEKRDRKREREELFEKSLELCPKNDEWEEFNNWMYYYNDEVEGTGKFGPCFGDFDDPEFDMNLWYELLTIWNSLGRPKAPEGWEPTE